MDIIDKIIEGLKDKGYLIKDNFDKLHLRGMIKDVLYVINKNDLLGGVSGSLHFNSNDVDGAYLIGVFNTTGMDGLAKEISRIKKLGINPHQMIDYNNKLQK